LGRWRAYSSEPGFSGKQKPGAAASQSLCPGPRGTKHLRLSSRAVKEREPAGCQSPSPQYPPLSFCLLSVIVTNTCDNNLPRGKVYLALSLRGFSSRGAGPVALGPWRASEPWRQRRGGKKLLTARWQEAETRKKWGEGRCVPTIPPSARTRPQWPTALPVGPSS
jgi:hypothetical protein